MSCRLWCIVTTSRLVYCYNTNFTSQVTVIHHVSLWHQKTGFSSKLLPLLWKIFWGNLHTKSYRYTPFPCLLLLMQTAMCLNADCTAFVHMSFVMLLTTLHVWCWRLSIFIGFIEHDSGSDVLPITVLHTVFMLLFSFLCMFTLINDAYFSKTKLNILQLFSCFYLTVFHGHILRISEDRELKSTNMEWSPVPCNPYWVSQKWWPVF